MPVEVTENTVSVVEVDAEHVLLVEGQVEPDIIEVGLVGPQGPRGPAGSGGGGSTWEDPHMEALLAASLAPGASAALDADAITSLMIGQLGGADVGSSVPMRFDIETVNGARVTVTTIYTQAGETEPWRPPDKTITTLVGDGTAHFGVTVTNLSPRDSADARVTLYWDEVAA